MSVRDSSRSMISRGLLRLFNLKGVALADGTCRKSVFFERKLDQLLILADENEAGTPLISELAPSWTRDGDE